MDGLRGTQQGLTVLVVRYYTFDGHGVGLCDNVALECIHLRALTRTMTSSKRASPEGVAGIRVTLFIVHRPCQPSFRKRVLPRCRRADRIRTGDYSMPSLDFYMVSFGLGRAGN